MTHPSKGELVQKLIIHIFMHQSKCLWRLHKMQVQLWIMVANLFILNLIHIIVLGILAFCTFISFRVGAGTIRGDQDYNLIFQLHRKFLFSLGKRENRCKKEEKKILDFQTFFLKIKHVFLPWTYMAYSENLEAQNQT